MCGSSPSKDIGGGQDISSPITLPRSYLGESCTDPLRSTRRKLQDTLLANVFWRLFGNIDMPFDERVGIMNGILGKADNRRL
jgi:hypothetical protein